MPKLVFRSPKSCLHKASNQAVVKFDRRLHCLGTDMRDGTEAWHWGKNLEQDRPRKIVFTWIVYLSEEFDPSNVTLTIEPDSGGCIANIIHELDAKWADYVAQTETGWSCMMQATDALLEN